jgi:hypothetical protein
MPSAIKGGSINLPKMMRHISHRTSQVRDLTFVRDAIYNKDYKKYPANATSGTELSGPPVNFGYETTSTTGASFTKAQDSGTITHSYTSTPEIVLPGLTMLQSPISSRSGSLERGGHRVTGACTFYAPSLDYIKALPNFTDTIAFAELESYDKLIDIERIIQNPSDVSSTGQQTIDLSPGSTYPAGYEIDRIQFKIKIAAATELVYFKLTGIDTTEKHITWTATDTFTPTDWVTVDLPLRDVITGDTQEVYIGGDNKTFTATSTLDIDKLIGGVSSSYLSSLIIDISGSASVELRDIYLYKEAEWRIQSIRDYRDEYMQIGAVRVRGDRSSRRRAYG